MKRFFRYSHFAPGASVHRSSDVAFAARIGAEHHDIGHRGAEHHLVGIQF